MKNFDGCYCTLDSWVGWCYCCYPDFGNGLYSFRHMNVLVIGFIGIAVDNLTAVVVLVEVEQVALVVVVSRDCNLLCPLTGVFVVANLFD